LTALINKNNKNENQLEIIDLGSSDNLAEYSRKGHSCVLQAIAFNILSQIYESRKDDVKKINKFKKAC
jgi:hypothetical protein